MVRVLVVGARRRRQGIGEFVAGWFHRLGAEVCAVAGTSRETAEAAAEILRRRYGVRPRAYGSIEAALNGEHPEIVALCSPYAVRRRQLELVAEAGAHCLSEKPLWWEESSGRLQTTKGLLEHFAERGLFLDTITQWPFTLETFYELWPETRHAPLESFDMHLSPISTGKTMVIDSAPHLISLLEALAGPGTIEEDEVEWRDPGRLELRFLYRHRRGTARVRFRLERVLEPPRPAGYAVNGFGVEREIEPETYAMAFTAGTRRAPLPDPLGRLIARFLENVAEGAPLPYEKLVRGMDHLERLVGSVERAELEQV